MSPAQAPIPRHRKRSESRGLLRSCHTCAAPVPASCAFKLNHAGEISGNKKGPPGTKQAAGDAGTKPQAESNRFFPTAKRAGTATGFLNSVRGPGSPVFTPASLIRIRRNSMRSKLAISACSERRQSHQRRQTRRSQPPPHRLKQMERDPKWRPITKLTR